MDFRTIIDVPRRIVTRALVGPESGPAATIEFSQSSDVYNLLKSTSFYECETQVLHRALMAGRPLFVETRAGTVVRILEPFATRVHDVAPSESEQGTILLRLSGSSMEARLSLADPNAQTWLAALNLALVRRDVLAVACDDEHRIVWVSADTSGFPLQPGTPEDLTADVSFVQNLPRYTRDTVNAIFRNIKKRRCDDSMAPHCLAYTADDFCWALAHKTALELAICGYEAGKLFLFAPQGHHLALCTDQRVTCEQRWHRHVAVYVNSIEGDGSTCRRVLDPFVFFHGDPGTEAEWLEALSASGLTPHAKPRQVYDLDPSGCTPADPTPCELLDSSGMSGLLDSAWCNLKGLLATQGKPPFKNCHCP